ncbi:MAG: recombination protein O N-terminal domain-containing protein, partial [Clostridia bacterium]|nr:recombination protein O N-terminal domain-containing protein [Clostridia bacterium]
MGEADRFVSLLTRDVGLVQASARGAQKLKSRNAGVTRLLSYGRFTLYQGRSGYIIGEVEPLHSFFDLNRD